MSSGLINKHILLTRPEGQAETLCQLITEKGGNPISFPVIEIVPLPPSQENLSRIYKQPEFDYIIFVSRNAVRITFEHYLKDCSLSHSRFVGIGAGTADSLQSLGIGNVLHAGEQATSERLLEIPEFMPDQIKAKTVLIVQGEGGRRLLSDTLLERGAKLETMAVYKRCLPKYNDEQIKEVWQNSRPDAIIITSNEGLDNLLQLTLDEYKIMLMNTPLVLMSDRIAAHAKELGFVSDINVANQQTDQGLLAMLVETVGE